MRLARIVGAFVALILTVTMGQALTQPSLAAAKPKHDVSAHGSPHSRRQLPHCLLRSYVPGEP